MKKIYFSLLVLFMQIASIKAQAPTYYFVSVDPSTGAHTLIDSIPGLKWTMPGQKVVAMDKYNNRFFLKALDVDSVYRLYTIDANNGSVLSSPVFTNYASDSNGGGVQQFEYDKTKNVLYGITRDVDFSMHYFITINPTTGVITNSVQLTGIWGVIEASTTYDDVNQRFYFTAGGSSNYNYYSLDALTGAILSSTPMVPVSFKHTMRYNHVMNALYSITSTSTTEIRKIDPATMSHTVIVTLPGTYGSVLGANFGTIDETTNRFTFVHTIGGMPANLTLCTVDLTTGNILYNLPFFFSNDIQDYSLCNLIYNDNSGVIYGVYRGAPNQAVVTGISANDFPKQGNFDLYPNPMSTAAYLDLKGNKNNVRVKIVNSSGAIMQDSNFQNVSGIEIHKKNLAPGIYFTTVIADNTISTRKMVVE